MGRARNFAASINCPLAIVDKRRPKANAIEVMNIVGDVSGKTCLMVDDMIDTAGTICQGAEALIKNGAKEVYACCTHGVLSGPALERLMASPIKEVAVLDTIDLADKLARAPSSKCFRWQNFSLLRSQRSIPIRRFPPFTKIKKPCCGYEDHCRAG